MGYSSWNTLRFLTHIHPLIRPAVCPSVRPSAGTRSALSSQSSSTNLYFIFRQLFEMLFFDFFPRKLIWNKVKAYRHRIELIFIGKVIVDDFCTLNFKIATCYWPRMQAFANKGLEKRSTFCLQKFNLFSKCLFTHTSRKVKK